MMETGMKSKLMAAVAVLAIVSAAGVAKAQTADDVAAMKAQAAALKKQNAELEARIRKIEQQQAKQEAQIASQASARPASSNFLADLTGIKGGPAECAPLTVGGPLTFCGITLYGTLDAGIGYASYGLPINANYYQGAEFVNKYAHNSYFGINPNGLSNNAIGIKFSREFLPGWSVVGQASTFFNPQSGQLQNTPASNIDNQGLNRNYFSNFGDGSRGGQAFNDQLFFGVANKQFGQLTFGRQTSLSNDMVSVYDPAGGANAFSPLGYSGTYVAGLGNSPNGRWDDAIKYRVSIPVNSEFTGRFAAIYKFADGNGGSNIGNVGLACTGKDKPVTGCAAPTFDVRSPYVYFPSRNDAGQIDLGGTFGSLSVDGVLGYFHQAISSSTPLSPAQLGGISSFVSNIFVDNVAQGTTTYGNSNSGTLSSTAQDIAGGALAAKYTWNQFNFYAGWAHEVYHNPENNVGIGAQPDQGNYVISSINNGAYPHAKLLDTVWVGTKYAFNSQLDFTVGYYHAMQNGYGFAWNTPGVSNYASNSLATCSLPQYVPFLTQGAGVNIGGHDWKYQAAPRSSTCSGTMNAVSTFADYHFTKAFDVYAGLMYSEVGGGLASGYFSSINWAPTAGARFTF